MNQIKTRLVNIAFILFITNGISMLSVIVWITAWHILGIIWILLAVSTVATLLVSLIPISYETEYKKYDTYSQYQSVYHQLGKIISPYIRHWQNSCSMKFLKIGHSIKQPNRISHPDNTADNHSFHNSTLSQSNKSFQPKGNDTGFAFLSFWSPDLSGRRISGWRGYCIYFPALH